MRGNLKSFAISSIERLYLLVIRVSHIALLPFGLERILLKSLLRDFPHGSNWAEKNSFLEKNIRRYLATSYRPHYSNDIEAEGRYLELAIAAANILFYIDFPRYTVLVERIHSYLSSLAKRDPSVRKTALWADNCHHRATVKHIMGEPSEAASLNAEAAEIYRSRNQLTDVLTYRGCVACCRMESLTVAEPYLIEAISERLEQQSKEIRQEYASDQTDLQKRQALYHASLLNCKIECHKQEPNPTRIRENLDIADQIEHGTTEYDRATQKMAISFFSAVALLLEGASQSEVRRKHQEAVSAVREQGAKGAAVNYFCLVWIPNSLEQRLCSFTEMGPLRKSYETVKEFKKNSRSINTKVFSGWTAAGVLLFISLQLPAWSAPLDFGGVVLPAYMIALFFYFGYLSSRADRLRGIISPLSSDAIKISRDLAGLAVVPSIAGLFSLWS